MTGYEMTDKLLIHAESSKASSFTPMSAKTLKRKCSGCTKKRKLLQRPSFSQYVPEQAPELVQNVLSSSGYPLDVASRAFLESRFRYDFSHIRVHTDSKTSNSLDAENAMAYIARRHAVFGRGQYAPKTNQGMHPLAQELTHVIQQSNSSSFVQRKWSDAPKGSASGARSRFVSPPSSSWNLGEFRVGTIRRIPVEGLTQGNQDHNPANEAVESAKGRAIVLIPVAINLQQPVEVLLHLHGHNVGYRQRKLKGGNPALQIGTVRDVDADRIEQQLESSGRPMIGVLAQGTTSSGFGSNFNSDAYLNDVFRVLGDMKIWGQGPAPQIRTVVLSGHSGAAGTITRIMAEPGQPRMPSKLGEVVLFDAIHPSQLPTIQRWVLSQLDKDLTALTAPGLTQNQQLSYLNMSLRFRGYYSKGSYAPTYMGLERAIKGKGGWFTRNAARLGGSSSPVFKHLVDNYQIIAVGHGSHEEVMGRDNRLQEALSALPAISSPTGGSNTGLVNPPSSSSTGASMPVARPTEQLRDAGAEDISGAPIPIQRMASSDTNHHRASQLEFGSPTDPLESEADHIAETIMTNGSLALNMPSALFDRIRIHTDQRAADSAMAVSARAYTVGNHVVFGAGQFAPHSTEGRHLLVHEFVHVLQQDSARNSQLHRVPWTPTHADEQTPARADRFAAQTFEVSISSLSGLSGKVSTETISVSVFVPSGALPGRNKVHIFFGPGAAVETGLASNEAGMNAVMTHGLRGASNRSEWILIGMPGRSSPRGEDNGFYTIDTNAIKTCLTAAGRATTTIDALRMSAHSRGYRGLRETLNQRLIAGPAPEKVVIFDAAYSSVDRALKQSPVSGGNVVAYNLGGDRLTVKDAKNIKLSASAMRAIGYSRIIQDAMATNPTLVIPPEIKSQLLTLPPRGKFTTVSHPVTGMKNIIDFANENAARIAQIVAIEGNRKKGLKTFIDNNNLIGLGRSYPSNIYSHHLFVAELAHEVVD